MAEIFLLGTLHQLHLEMGFYSLADLRSIVEHIQPDVICVELSPAMLKECERLANKVESFDVLLPYADEHGCSIVPLEPDEPRRSEILELQKNAYAELQEQDPRAEALFDEFLDLFYDELFSSWNSVLDVHLETTQALIRMKHAFQERVFGEGEVAGWGAWNEHFLERIEAAAAENPGVRVLVGVGVEHVYWLQERLMGKTGLELADMQAILDAWEKGILDGG